MKKLFLFSIIISLSMMSINSYADKITIKGSPIVVEKQGEVYYVPSSTVVSSSPYFFSVNDTKQVCYSEAQPALANIDLGVMSFKMGNDIVKVHCYSYSPDYFVISSN